MNRLHLASFFSLLVLFAPGCAEGTDESSDGDGEDVAEAQDSVVGGNALGINALGINALGINALGINALGVNALGVNALGINSLAVLQSDTLDGALGRDLIKYTVSCALTPTHSFAFSWTDAAGTVHAEEYWGLLGIAPGWATGPLTDVTQQRLVSACLASRTNWYGVPVMLSLRSKVDPLRTSVLSAELDAYQHVEGAFWGNLFTATPHLNTCYVSANVNLSRAANRDCAAGHLDANGQPVPCGMINILGDCNDYCSNLDPHERWFNSCVDPGEPGSPSYSAVISAALP